MKVDQKTLDSLTSNLVNAVSSFYKKNRHPINSVVSYDCKTDDFHIDYLKESLFKDHTSILGSLYKIGRSHGNRNHSIGSVSFISEVSSRTGFADYYDHDFILIQSQSKDELKSTIEIPIVFDEKVWITHPKRLNETIMAADLKFQKYFDGYFAAIWER